MYVLQNESGLWQEKSRLEEERHVFVEQKENFEKEKQKYMEALRKLDREVKIYLRMYVNIWCLYV